MPSHFSPEEQIYEAMRCGKSVPFSFAIGGVKYKAVFEHKEAHDRRRGLSRMSSMDSLASSVSSSSNSSFGVGHRLGKARRY